MMTRSIVMAASLALVPAMAFAATTTVQRAGMAATHATEASKASSAAQAAGHRGPTAAAHHRKAAGHHRKAGAQHEEAAKKS